MHPRISTPLAAVALACASLVHAQPATVVKIASLDAMSGPMAGLGLNVLKSFQYSARLANEQSWAGAVKFEVVPFDNRLSAQEALSQLNSIIGQNIRYVVQGASSSAVAWRCRRPSKSTTAATPARKSST